MSQLSLAIATDARLLALSVAARVAIGQEPVWRSAVIGWKEGVWRRLTDVALWSLNLN